MVRVLHLPLAHSALGEAIGSLSFIQRESERERKSIGPNPERSVRQTKQMAVPIIRPNWPFDRYGMGPSKGPEECSRYRSSFSLARSWTKMYEFKIARFFFFLFFLNRAYPSKRWSSSHFAIWRKRKTEFSVWVSFLINGSILNFAISSFILLQIVGQSLSAETRTFIPWRHLHIVPHSHDFFLQFRILRSTRSFKIILSKTEYTVL